LLPVPWPEGTWAEAVIEKLHQRMVALPSLNEVDWDRAVRVLVTDGLLVLHGTWRGRRYCEVGSRLNHFGPLQRRLQRLLGTHWAIVRGKASGAACWGEPSRRPACTVVAVIRRPASSERGPWRPRTGGYRFFAPTR
jgi:hypothetical protein